MRKILTFSGILVIALVLTTSTFAYTYTNTSATALNGTFADGAWATYETSVIQPDWQQVMPGGIYDSEILVPNGPGDMTDISFQYPDAGEHWDKVDDMPADDTETFLQTSRFSQYKTDLFNLTDHQPFEEGEVKEIKSITIYFRFAGSSDGHDHINLDESSDEINSQFDTEDRRRPDNGGDYNGYAKSVIMTYGQVFEGIEEVQSGDTYVTRSYEWRGNPATGKLWTWDDVNELQAGISLKGERGRRPASVTQVYVAVNYEKKITQNEVPMGDLFEITPHPDYTGDMQVKIYLTNTAQLIKAYSYLNMELYIAKSVEAQKPPIFQILSLENGVATFNIDGGSALIYTVEVYGGAYRLVSSEPDEWAEGWSVVPELYCEVTQR